MSFLKVIRAYLLDRSGNLDILNMNMYFFNYTENILSKCGRNVSFMMEILLESMSVLYLYTIKLIYVKNENT